MALRQVFDHSLQPRKGWFEDAPLDFAAKLSANVTFAPVFAGRVVHVNSVGEFEMGAAGVQVPIFLMRNSDDHDVGTDQSTDAYGLIPPGRVMAGLVALGHYEVEDTEYDTLQNYLPNQPLRAVADNGNATTGGRLTNQGITLATNTVCGWVSRGVVKNSDNRNTLAFWTDFYPGSA